jgi:integrase
MASTSRRPRGLLLRGGVWHIDKIIFGRRICRSTGTSDLAEGEALLARQVTEEREVHLFGRQRVPRTFVKNGLDRFVVLNRIARSVIESCRGKHPEFVFTHESKPVTKIYNSGWKAARRRAAARYENELKMPCPFGFRSVRVHDLKHTLGHRLRVAGVGFEDRKVLLGHKSDHITTHYSAPEIGALIEASERVCDLESRTSHALSIVRARA